MVKRREMTIATAFLALCLVGLYVIDIASENGWLVLVAYGVIVAAYRTWVAGKDAQAVLNALGSPNRLDAHQRQHATNRKRLPRAYTRMTRKQTTGC